MMSASKTGADTLKLSGGRLCLDFTNTVEGRSDNRPHEYLLSYRDLVAWSRHAGSISEREATQLAEHVVLNEAEVDTVYKRAIDLREALYRIFSEVAAKRRPAQPDLATLNGILADAMAQAEIIPVEDGFVWGWTNASGARNGLLWPVARSAAELLTASDELQRVRECPGDYCDWLFLDTSKNHTRRWCSMETCGNVAKARRHYQRRAVPKHTPRGSQTLA
jgi:predicted RNA-binding Zn ribbon-like protein